MVVMAIIAFASLGVSLALPDPARSHLDKEANRLAALMDTARAYSRATGMPVTWRVTATGFEFDGLPASGIERLSQESHWSDAAITSTTSQVILGPEPIIPAQQIDLFLGSLQTRIATDGLQPFTIQQHTSLQTRGAKP